MTGRTRSPRIAATRPVGAAAQRFSSSSTPALTTMAEAIRELDLYADTDEAEAARVLVALLDLDENAALAFPRG